MEENMDYIWESLLNNKEDVFFKQAKVFSPYYEPSPEYLNSSDKYQSVVEFNSMYRFEDICLPLFTAQVGKEEEWRDYLFDMIIHMLINEDLRDGITKKEYRIRYTMISVNQGAYGKWAKENFCNLTRENQYLAAQYIVEQENMGESVQLFSKASIELLFVGAVYQNSIKTKELLLYVGIEKTVEYDTIIKIAENFFLPIDYSLRVFWKTHFGLIGEKQTMNYEKIEIF